MAGKTQKHTAVFAKMLARKLLDRGFDEETIFSGTGFDISLLDQEAPVAEAADSFDFFEQAATLTNNDTFGFQLGKGQDIRRIGLVCYVGLAAPNVLGFLTNYSRYALVISEVLEFDMSNLQNRGLMKWWYSSSPHLQRRQYVEYSATVFLNTLRHYSGSQITPKHVNFEHLRRNNSDEIETFFGCEITYGAGHNSFEFKNTDLELPLISADKQLLKVLQDYGDQVLSEKKQSLPGLVFEVERVIADQLAQGAANLENVAAQLGMSPRTLSRKLAAEGTSFFRVLEDLRKSLSKSYLKDSDLVLAEIAFLLGYSGLSSFNDAFKRWTGHSPGQFRSH